MNYNHILRRFVLLIIILFFTTGITAQDTGSGLQFLNISPSAPTLALSGSATASPSGPASIYFNPSLLALDERSSADVNYTIWIADTSIQFVALNHVRDRSSLAAGLLHSGSDRNNPTQEGLFSVSYLTLSGAAAHRIGPFAAGISAHYVREEVFQFRANGYSITAGLIASLYGDRIRSAVSLTNIGQMHSLDNQTRSLPTGINAGLSADILEVATSGFNDLPILLSLHVNWYRSVDNSESSHGFIDSDLNSILSAGLSAQIGTLFTIMAGYRGGGSERPFSTGVALSVDPIRLHYAIVPFTTGFGTVHSFGVIYLF